MAGTALVVSTFSVLAFEIDNDGVVGDPLNLRLDGIQKNKTITAFLTRPDQSVLRWAFPTDQWGVLEASIAGNFLQSAGYYQLSINGIQQEFKRTSAPLSTGRSRVEFVPSAEDTAEKKYFSVQLVDRYGNPVVGSEVQAFSSRSKDQVTLTPDPQFPQRWKGAVVGGDSGSATITVMADGKFLLSRPTVSFQDSFYGVGQGDIGSFLQAQLFDDQGSSAADYITIEDFPTSLELGEFATFTVTMHTDQGSVATGYEGRIRFTSSDDQAELPADFQFTENNRGQHIFSLAVSFSTPGVQTLGVHAVEDHTIFGEISVTVKDASGALTSGSGNDSDSSDGSGDSNSGSGSGDGSSSSSGSSGSGSSGGSSDSGDGSSGSGDGSSSSSGSSGSGSSGGSSDSGDGSSGSGDGSSSSSGSSGSGSSGGSSDSGDGSSGSGDGSSSSSGSSGSGSSGGSSDSGDGSDDNDDSPIKISTPLAGAYRDRQIVVSGSALGFPYVQISNGVVTLSDKVPVDSAGHFIFETPALADGKHVLEVSDLTGNIISAPVIIQIDNTPPVAVSATIKPRTTVSPKQVVQLDITANETLSKAVCYLNDSPLSLKEKDDGSFTGLITTPSTCGVYPLECRLQDLLGNELQEPSVEVITVCDPSKDLDGDGIPDDAEVSKDEDQDGVGDEQESNLKDDDKDGISNQKDPDNDSDGGGVTNEEEKKAGTNPLDPGDDVLSKNIPPTAISNPIAVPEGNQVTIFWSPADDDEAVDHYRIRFGISPDQLEQEQQTPDNRTQWFITGLMNDVKYYFQVFAVDTDAEEGPGSRILEVTPGEAPITVEPEVAAQEAEVSTTGPGQSGLIALLSFLLVGSWWLLSRR